MMLPIGLVVALVASGLLGTLAARRRGARRHGRVASAPARPAPTRPFESLFDRPASTDAARALVDRARAPTATGARPRPVPQRPAPGQGHLRVIVCEPAAAECPSCSAPLVRRNDARLGRAYLGCSSFPRCRATRPLSPADPPRRVGKAAQERSSHPA